MTHCRFIGGVLAMAAVASCGAPTAQVEPTAVAPVAGQSSEKSVAAGSTVKNASGAAMPASARSAFSEGMRLASSDTSAALTAFRQALSVAPQYAEAHANIGALLLTQGDAAGAVESYNNALRARADYVPAILGLAVAYEQLGRAVDARAALLPHVAKDPSLRAALAQFYARQGKLDDAHAQAVETLRADERSAGAMLALGMAYRRQRKYELAELALTQAIENDASLGPAYHELGLVLLARDDKVRALQAFEQAATASPSVAAIENNVGVLQTAVGAYKPAVEALQRAATLSHDRAEYLVNLGNALRGDQRIAEAEQAYKRALASNANMPAALFNLGVLYLDNDVSGVDLTTRFQTCIKYLQEYTAVAKPAGAEADRIADYIKTANTGIDNETKRVARERRRAEKDAKENKDKAADQAPQVKTAPKDVAKTEAASTPSAAPLETKKAEPVVEQKPPVKTPPKPEAQPKPVTPPPVSSDEEVEPLPELPPLEELPPVEPRKKAVKAKTKRAKNKRKATR